jgi:hypothetical protein
MGGDPAGRRERVQWRTGASGCHDYDGDAEGLGWASDGCEV